MAVERTISLLKRAGIAAAGAGIALTYKELRKPDSPTRNAVLGRLADFIGTTERTNPDSFLFQLPGRWRSAGVLAELIAQPGTLWNAETVLAESLLQRLNPLMEANAFCMEAKPADRKIFPGYYVIKEHGDPVTSVTMPGSETTTSVATQRFYLAGKRFVPPRLQVAEDTSS